MLRWFQFKTLHRIIETNSYLTKRNLISNANCRNCDNVKESIEHMFFYCPSIQTLWHDLQNWIKNKINYNLDLDFSSILFGKTKLPSVNRVTNFVILHTKYFIFKMKTQYKEVNILNLQNYLKEQFYIEKYLMFKKCKWKVFDKYWKSWMNLFNDN